MLSLHGSETEITELREEVSEEGEATGLLETIYKDGKLVKEVTLSEIRALLEKQLATEMMASADMT